MTSHSFDTVPDGVIANDIFKYFSFSKRIIVFTLVCKRWRQIFESSILNGSCLIDCVTHAICVPIMAAKKYQATALRLNKAVNNCHELIIGRSLQYSPRLNTLIINLEMSIEGIDKKYTSQITTLVINKQLRTSEQRICKIFPNLKRHAQ